MNKSTIKTIAYIILGVAVFIGASLLESGRIEQLGM
jgi:hypothetical protein